MNSVAADRPDADGTVHALFAHRAAAHPHRTAVVCGSESLGYGELNRRANRIAWRLRDLGVESGTRVGLCVDRSVDMVVGMLAILKAGGAYVPMDPSYPPERLSFITHDSGVRVVLGRPDAVPGHDAVRFLALDDPESDAFPPTDPPCAASAHDIAYVIYTSGSTGVPKGVLTTHGNVRNLVLDQNYLTITPQDRLSAMASLSFDASTLEIWGALLNGAACHVYSFRDGGVTEFFAALRRDEITVSALTSAIFRIMEPEHFELAKGLRAIFFGGDSVRGDIVARARELFAGALIHVYGPTETTSFSVYLAAGATVPESALMPIGRPIRGVSVRVAGPDGEPVPDGSAGELWIGGRGVALGYLNRPELTGQRFVPDPGAPGERLYRTGDLVRIDENGDLRFLGRMDRQLKIRGHRIEPGEVEAVIVRHPQVKDSVVVGRADSVGDKRLHAYIVMAVGDSSDVIAELRGLVRESLPVHQHPATYTVIESIPYTPNLKVDETRLPDPLEPAEPVSGAPAGELQTILTELWSAALDLPAIGPDDNFFELGGDSMLALRLALAMEKTLGARFGSGVILKYPTVREFSDALNDGRIGVGHERAGAEQ